MSVNSVLTAKHTRSRLSQLFVLSIVSFLLLPSTAHAYVDPGSGSVIVSTILGLIAAVGYTFRKYFYKMKRTIMGGKSESDAGGKTGSED